MAYDLLIKDGNVVLEDAIESLDIAINDGKIVALGHFSEDESKEVITAKDAYVFPGAVDVHVHFNEPGLEAWEGFNTGSSLLAAGGITTFFDMPLNGIPSTINKTNVIQKAERASNTSFLDFGLWGGLVPGNIDELEEMSKQGVVGFKAFMSPSGNEAFESVDDNTLLAGMRKIASLGKILALHAESTPIIAFLEQEAKSKGDTSIPAYVASRPAEAELEAVTRALIFAKITGCRLHFVHISSIEAIRAIGKYKQEGLDVSLETCPHYLLYNESDFERIGNVAKCAPPLRSESNQHALIEALMKNDIDLLSSDHSPCPKEKKQGNNVFETWGGISGGQFTLLSAIEIAAKKNISFTEVAKWTASHPAQRFSLENKGKLKVGYDADIAIVTLNAFTVTKKELYAKHSYSLYEGHQFPATVLATIQRGNLIYQDSTIFPSHALGTWQKVY